MRKLNLIFVLVEIIVIKGEGEFIKFLKFLKFLKRELILSEIKYCTLNNFIKIFF
jgi:hypothetical protein